MLLTENNPRILFVCKLTIYFRNLKRDATKVINKIIISPLISMKAAHPPAAGNLSAGRSQGSRGRGWEWGQYGVDWRRLLENRWQSATPTDTHPGEVSSAIAPFLASMAGSTHHKVPWNTDSLRHRISIQRRN